jgi:choline dehydrogenase-like flavoprotein
LLSGVGPRAELEKNGIPLVYDLPGVGENLQDHLDIHITCLDKTRISLSFRPDSIWRNIVSLSQYLWKKRGELTSNYTQAVGFTKTDPNKLAPDLQWHFAASMYTESARFLKPVFSNYGYLLMTCLLHPESRGRLTLKSNDPMEKPLINPNYLAIDSDLDAMVTGFKKAREILAQQAFAPYFLKEFEPGEQVQTNEQIRQYIRQRAETIYHPVGTCKMGIDPMAVVDPNQLKVYGIENVRVIDASIMPTIPSGNTNTPTTMIAEKGADIILKIKGQ